MSLALVIRNFATTVVMLSFRSDSH